MVTTRPQNSGTPQRGASLARRSRAPSRRCSVLAASLGCALAAAIFGSFGCRGLRDSGPKATPTAGAAVSSSPVAHETSPAPAGASPTPARAVPTPKAAAAKCTPAKPFAGSGSSVMTGDRTFDIHVPPSYDGTRAMPLVINLHGAGSNAQQQAFYSGFNKKADAEGFITLTPDATGTPKAWNFLPLPNGADDIGFIRDMLDRVETDFCVDATKVYATGISSGAAMSVRLACSLQDRIAAIGIVAALWYPPQCPTAKAMPVLEFHRDADPVVPFKGGSVATSGIPSPDVQQAAAAWARADDCNATPAQARPAAHVHTLAYSECRDNAAVVLYVVEGGGHTWPGAPVDVNALGQTNHEISATDEIWSFFSAH